jgi:hypothetical protein
MTAQDGGFGVVMVFRGIKVHVNLLVYGSASEMDMVLTCSGRATGTLVEERPEPGESFSEGSLVKKPATI